MIIPIPPASQAVYLLKRLIAEDERVGATPEVVGDEQAAIAAVAMLADRAPGGPRHCHAI